MHKSDPLYGVYGSKSHNAGRGDRSRPTERAGTARFGGSSGFASPRASQGTVRGYLNVIDSRASVTFSKASLTVSLTLAMTLPTESSALIV